MTLANGKPQPPSASNAVYQQRQMRNSFLNHTMVKGQASSQTKRTEGEQLYSQYSNTQFKTLDMRQKDGSIQGHGQLQ